MMRTKPPLNIGDRIEVSGEIRRVDGPFAPDPMTMTVLFPGSARSVVLDATLANRDPESLKVGVFVQFQGVLTHINPSAERQREAVVQLDAYPYELTLPMRDLKKI